MARLVTKLDAGSPLVWKEAGHCRHGPHRHRVARRAKAFGLDIHYYSRSKRPKSLEAELGATYWDNLEDMLANVDIVTLHTPATRATSHLINRDNIQLMKPDAILVNLARPNLIDEDALIDAIESGKIGGAA